VIAAVARAALIQYHEHQITDEDGPHMHHWEPILWHCRGCGDFDPPE